MPTSARARALTSSITHVHRLLPGVYQLRVSPGIFGTTNTFQVDALVEVRQPNAVGTVTLATNGSRYYFGRNEAIVVAAGLRVNSSAAAAAGVRAPQTVPIEIVFEGAPSSEGPSTAVVVANGSATLGVNNNATWTLPSQLTARLAVGRYLATVPDAFLASASLSVSPQPFFIGRSFDRPVFKINQYGDYTAGYPSPEIGSYGDSAGTGAPSFGPYFTVAEAVEGHLARSTALGVNMYVDRLGSGDLLSLFGRTLQPPTDFAARVLADNASVVPASLVQPGVEARSTTGYGAHGIEQRAILLYMDAGLPVGTGFDKRTPEQFGDAIVEIDRAAGVTPSFTGWSWAANWWIGSNYGCAALENPAKITACKAALQSAKANGTYDPILDAQAAVWLAYAVDAEREFRANSSLALPGGISGMTGPYRAVGVIPPITFAGADEIDLHYQSEQIQPPQSAGHNAAYQGRPGKPNFAHYEMTNDDGTGLFVMNDQIQLLMRSARGVGWSGPIKNMIAPSDPRDGISGLVSSFRAFNNAVLRDYGPFFVALNNSDDVAIVVSTRMLKIDDWQQGGVGGTYFDQLYEAFNSFMYAGMPACFIFVEDLPRFGSGWLTKFKVVVVVGQIVPLDPPLAAALAPASVRVVYDQTTRPNVGLPAHATQLAWAFNFTGSPAASSAWQDDSAYQRFQDAFVAAGTALRTALLDVVQPEIDTGNRQILSSTLVPGGASQPSGAQGRFVWVYNNELLGLSPGLVWRVSTIMTQRIAQTACVTLNARPGETVYDVFGLREASAPHGNCTEADLQSLPGRLFAVLPSKIASVNVSASFARATGLLSVKVAVDGPTTLVPARVTVTAATTGERLESRAIVVDVGAGWAATFVVPVPFNDSHVVVRCSELFGGLSGEAVVRVGEARAATKRAGAVVPPAAARAAETWFGLHFKAAVASSDGSAVLLTAAHVGDNAVCVDAATGKEKWRARLGHFWAYSPVAAHGLGGTFAAQGFDLLDSHGMQVYQIDQSTGASPRRFSLPAYPDRGTSWADATLLGEPYHSAFAVGGGWVAAAGDLALVVWSNDGDLLWNQTWYEQQVRKYVYLVAVDADTLAVLDPTELDITAYSGKTGQRLWSVQVTHTGTLLGGVASSDGTTLVAWGSAGVFVVRRGALAFTLGVAAEAVAVAPDGSYVAVTTAGADKKATGVEVYATAGPTWKLLWSYRADEYVRNPTFGGPVARGGQTVLAFGTDLGTVLVADAATGAVMDTFDAESGCAFAFLPDGTLVLASWMGRVTALAPVTFETKWSVTLQSAENGLEGTLLRPDTTPTTAANITNAAWSLPPPGGAPAVNLLNSTPSLIYAQHDPLGAGDPVQFNHPAARLHDNNATAPGLWLSWSDLNMVDSGWKDDLWLYVDGFRNLFEVSAVGFVEDEGTPSSWLRDVRLEWWNKTAGAWVLAQHLVSDSPVHTHELAEPITATTLRIGKANPSGTSSMWPVGNIGLAELVFHGKSLGCSAGDVQAKRAVATLYDEDATDVNKAFQNGFNPAWEIITGLQWAYSGDQAIGMTKAQPAMHPAYDPSGTFGSSIANFCFQVVESPSPGQYRWVQFAWRAMSASTTGTSLWIGADGYRGMVAFAAGKVGPPIQQERARVTTASSAPIAWTVVRQDLWSLANLTAREGSVFNVTALAFGSVGDGASFDQIILCRTEADCANTRPLPHVASDPWGDQLGVVSATAPG